MPEPIPCPHAGSGVHGWLFSQALSLHHTTPAPRIMEILESESANCGRRVMLKEIQDAIANAARVFRPATTRQAVHPAPRKWPAVNQEQVEAIMADGSGLADLWEAAPHRIEDSESHTEAIIDEMFPGDPLLCCGVSSKEFATKPRSEWRGELDGLPFIVPSPMSKVTGLTKTGTASQHCLDNTGPRRFLVVEFDTGPIDQHAAILLHLATKAPLTLAVHSGGKSLHGWFHCAGRSEDKLHGFMRYAVSLGADYATWSRFQFVRMPDGTRDNGKRQTIFFFNPKGLDASTR